MFQDGTRTMNGAKDGELALIDGLEEVRAARRTPHAAQGGLHLGKARVALALEQDG